MAGEEEGAPQEIERECCLALALRRNPTLIPRIESMRSTKWEVIHKIKRKRAGVEGSVGVAEQGVL